MEEGVVEHANQEKGYGFLKVDGYEKNVFFHVRDLIGTAFEDIQKGNVVSISSIEETEKGYAARGIRLI